MIKTYPKEVFIAMGMRMAENISYYIFTIVSITYVTTYLDQDKDLILKMLLIAAALQFFLVPAVGALSDKVGRRPLYFTGALGVGVWSFFFFGLLDTNRAGPVLLAVVVGLFFHTLMYAPQAAFFSELFGTSVRYTGASVGYQLASIFAGALAPIIAVDLLGSADEKNTFAVALYVAAASVLTIVAVLFAKETRGHLAAPRPCGARRARLTGPLLVSPLAATCLLGGLGDAGLPRLPAAWRSRSTPGCFASPSAGSSSHVSRAPGCWSKAAARSSGTTRFSTSSSRVQVPFSFADVDDACWPAGPIRPSASSRSMRSLFGRDHPLVVRRRVNQSIVRSSSSLEPLLSTQPTASASVTACVVLQRSPGPCASSRTPARRLGSTSWCSSSHFAPLRRRSRAAPVRASRRRHLLTPRVR